MARLSEQLKYFIAKKVSEDADWRGVEIVLSGHEVGYLTSGHFDISSVQFGFARSQEKENTRLWNISDSRKLNRATTPTFAIVSTDSMLILSCWVY